MIASGEQGNGDCGVEVFVVVFGPQIVVVPAGSLPVMLHEKHFLESLAEKVVPCVVVKCLCFVPCGDSCSEMLLGWIECSPT